MKGAKTARRDKPTQPAKAKAAIRSAAAGEDQLDIFGGDS